MRLSLLLPVAFAAGSFAAALPQAADGTPVVQMLLAKFQSGIDDLDTTVKGIMTVDANSVAPLATKGQALGDTIKDATKQVQAAPPIQLTSAIALQDSAAKLTTSVNKLADDFVAKAPLFKMANLNSAVTMVISAQKAPAMELVKAVTEKLPEAVRPIAEQQTKGVTDALDRIAKAYA